MSVYFSIQLLQILHAHEAHENVFFLWCINSSERNLLRRLFLASPIISSLTVTWTYFDHFHTSDIELSFSDLLWHILKTCFFRTFYIDFKIFLSLICWIFLLIMARSMLCICRFYRYHFVFVLCSPSYDLCFLFS